MDVKEYQEKAATTAIYDQKLLNRLDQEMAEILSAYVGQYGDSTDQIVTEMAATFKQKIILDILMPLMRISYVGLGMGEVGEIQNKAKKIIRDHGGHITDEHREDLKGELGDVLWYVAAACKELDLDMNEVAQGNIDKLESRKERGVLTGSGDNR